MGSLLELFDKYRCLLKRDDNSMDVNEKKLKTKEKNLIKIRVSKALAWQAGNSRCGHWFTIHLIAINIAMTKERLMNSSFYGLATTY